MFRKILLLVIISTASLNALDLEKESDIKSNFVMMHAAKDAANEKNIEKFREYYTLISESESESEKELEKDKILISAIRQNGNLCPFYISLARKGDINDLTRLVSMDCLLTIDIRCAVFKEALTSYGNNKDAWCDEDKAKPYEIFLSMHVDSVDKALQANYRRIVLKEETLSRHSFTAEQQAAFDREAESWSGISF